MGQINVQINGFIRSEPGHREPDGLFDQDRRFLFRLDDDCQRRRPVCGRRKIRRRYPQPEAIQNEMNALSLNKNMQGVTIDMLCSFEGFCVSRNNFGSL